MSLNEDIRWIQRSTHFAKALSQLEEAVALAKQRPLSKLEEQGLIKAFEFTFELAWNVLKDYFEAQGETDLHGSRDVIRLAFRRGLIKDGETWMDMIKDRILSTHTYNEETARKITEAIIQRYHTEFVKLNNFMQILKKQDI